MSGFLHGLRRTSGAKSLLNLQNHGPCVERSWRHFLKRGGSLFGEQKGKHAETH